uniref:Uncharacterized protein n=1 Tax=Arundo donax TaxID=35708 RepID=A0A0A8ZDK5_ARUDO
MAATYHAAVAAAAYHAAVAFPSFLGGGRQGRRPPPSPDPRGEGVGGGEICPSPQRIRPNLGPASLGSSASIQRRWCRGVQARPVHLGGAARLL